MDTREGLRPYKKQRLGFEGVLVDIIKPSSRNGYTYGLVFGSVYAPNEKIELNHVVIKVNKGAIGEMKVKVGIELFKRYSFTARIDSYVKTAKFSNIAAKKEAFMLADIKPHKIKQVELSHMEQPTNYVMDRIRNVLLCKSREVLHTEEELINMVRDIPNDGSVEKFIDEFTSSYQLTKITMHDVVDVIYGKAI